MVLRDGWAVALVCAALGAIAMVLTVGVAGPPLDPALRRLVWAGARGALAIALLDWARTRSAIAVSLLAVAPTMLLAAGLEHGLVHAAPLAAIALAAGQRARDTRTWTASALSVTLVLGAAWLGGDEQTPFASGLWAYVLEMGSLVATVALAARPTRALAVTGASLAVAGLAGYVGLFATLLTAGLGASAPWLGIAGLANACIFALYAGLALLVLAARRGRTATDARASA